MKELYCDYLIVGAGAAGCVLSNRLSHNSNNSVICIEAGGKDTNFFIKIPAGFSKTVYNDKINWPYFTEETENTANRKIRFPRGKVLGGSSSINGHLYVRGQARDYDGWAQKGCTGWSWTDVLPYFMKAETRPTGNKNYRGNKGPLYISDLTSPHPAAKLFIETAHGIGIKKNMDYNSGNQEGSFLYQTMIKNSMRWSASDAYLKPILSKNNFKLLIHTYLHKIIFKNKKIKSVIIKQGLNFKKILINKELILSAGAINSPQILQNNGIGNQLKLKELGIECIQNIPEVGQNLKDHYAIRIAMRTKNISTFNTESKGLSLLKEIFNYYFFKKGLLTNPVSTAGVFAKTKKELSSPDIQMLFAPASFENENAGTSGLERLDGITCGITQLRPSSKGYVEIKSNNIYEPPIINPKYLDNDFDKETLINGVKLVRKICSSKPISDFCREETIPGKQISTNDQIIDYARKFGSTVYHPIGTCRMGNDPNSVVDLDLKVRGIKNLRVIDASIMPDMVSGNTYAATNMIAEKGSDLILSSIN